MLESILRRVTAPNLIPNVSQIANVHLRENFGVWYLLPTPSDAIAVKLLSVSACIRKADMRAMKFGRQTLPMTLLFHHKKCHNVPRRAFKTTSSLTVPLVDSIVTTMESRDITKLQQVVFRHVFRSIPLKKAAREAGISFWRVHTPYHNWRKIFHSVNCNIPAIFRLWYIPVGDLLH